MLDRLGDELSANATLDLGHGAPIGIAGLRSQRRYVETFLAAVIAASDLDAEARRREVVDVDARHRAGCQAAESLLELSIEPVLATLVGEELVNAVADVQIVADHVRLAGHLRVPDVGREPLPALVFTGPFTGVKEQVVGEYV